MQNRHAKIIKCNVVARKQRGFSLIELLVVMAIIGILTTIVSVTFSSVRQKAVIAGAELFEASLYHNFGYQAVALWNFDEGVDKVTRDDSDNRSIIALANDPTVLWASTTDARQGNSAITLKGGTVDVPASTTLTTFDPHKGSISFWLNLKVPSGSGIFCNNGELDTYAQFCVLDTGTTGKFIELDWNGGGYGKQLQTDIDPHIYLGVWTHAAVSWNIPQGQETGTVGIYINGHEVASSSEYVLPERLGSAPYAFCVGGDCHGDNIIGSIDTMRVYTEPI